MQKQWKKFHLIHSALLLKGRQSIVNLMSLRLLFFYLGGLLAEWLRYWTLNHDIVGSSPAVLLVFTA